MLIPVLVVLRGSKEDSKENFPINFYHLREHQYHHEQNFVRDMNIKSTAGKALEGNDEHAIEH